MRKQEEIKEDNIITIIPEYGRQKLLGYAESFRELAELFEEERVEIPTEDKDRQEYLWQKKLHESRGLLADHLKEMAHIMSDVAGEAYRYRPVGERKYKQVAHYLKDAGILLKNFMILENEDGHLTLSLMMKPQTQENVTTEDVGSLISAAMNIRLHMSGQAPLFMTREWNTYYFQEEPSFHVLTGFAKATKETEKISGDNYSFCETEQGKMAAILSDGMGSGEKACEESGKVIEMMERLMEAGFRKEAAIQIINGALAAGEQEQNMSTLDICELNLYTGACENRCGMHLYQKRTSCGQAFRKKSSAWRFPADRAGNDLQTASGRRLYYHAFRRCAGCVGTGNRRGNSAGTDWKNIAYEPGRNRKTDIELLPSSEQGKNQG